MSRTLTIDPVTRIEGHAKVHLELGDDGKVVSALMQVMEFRGFEEFVKGMQVELMPTLVTRICGTCPHAHHLVAAKALDKVFGAAPPRAALLLRELLNLGSQIHSHAIHFFLLAGPDLFLGIEAPPAKRNVLGILEAAPDLAKAALRLRSIGSRITELVGGRGTHPVTCVAGGLSSPITAETRDQLRKLTAEGLTLAKVAFAEGKKALGKNRDVMVNLRSPSNDLATVNGGKHEIYDGPLRLRRVDGAVAYEFAIDDYKKHLYEEAVATSYTKTVLARDPGGPAAPLRVGALARVNCSDTMDTPLAQAELTQFKSKAGNPCHLTAMSHYARLIELLHFAEKAAQIVEDDEILSANVRTPLQNKPHSAIAHVEAPRGVLVHDYEVNGEGYITAANFLVATQLSLSSINASIRSVGDLFLGKPDDILLNGVEFAIRTYDPCLSCSTHQLGEMPLEVVISHDGRVLRRAVR
jgi:coenzyme F420-reducing hydrogenase alpha subunit